MVVSDTNIVSPNIVIHSPYYKLPRRQIVISLDLLSYLQQCPFRIGASFVYVVMESSGLCIF
jgi:hypothetical protein